jgi:hypothetical protein
MRPINRDGRSGCAITGAVALFNYVRRNLHVSLRLTPRFSIRASALAAALALVRPAAAQYPGQVSTTTGPMLRAVSVFEWTGDEQHPKASRIIPITVFDGQQLQDGAIYLARPEPLALESEVEYQLKQDGKNVGLFVIQDAALEQGSWVGHGAFRDLPKPKPVAPPMWKGDEDDAASDEPVLHRKHHADDPSSSGGSASSSQASQGPPPDPDRPTLHRSGGSNSGDSNSSDSGTASNGPAPDPDRPTLSNPPPSPSSSSAPDANRPAPKKNSSDDDSYVSSMPDLSDPDRPKLVHGKTDYAGPAVLPSFVGLPADMEQSIAVSDSRTTPEHVWSYSWANSADEAKYKADLEDLARTALGLTPPAQPAPKKSTGSHKTQLSLPAPPAPLLDEQFHVFELAYGSGATLVLSTHTAGSGADEKFVTLIAQPDLYGSLVVLAKNVTDASHLDQNPRMRLIDAVDAMADNRGELLFELRGATQRQFALYRVLRGQATELFVTGSREFAPTSN